MITSIFKKSKSINFIIIFFIALLAFFIAKTKLTHDSVSFIFIVKQLALFLVVCASILLLNFIVSKNSLTKKNDYEILLFCLFLLFITETTSNSHILVSNFFVLLGLRRIISLRSQKEVKKKLLDAAFWITVASLFYFWAILFFALIFISLILYSDNNIRHWIIPITGAITVTVIAFTASILLNENFFELYNISTDVSYDFSQYNSLKYLVAITTLLSFGIWSSIYYLNNIKKKKKASRSSFKIIIIAALIGFSIVIHAPNKNGSEFLFLYAPLAIIISNYIDIIKEKWFEEVFLGVLVFTPFVILFLEFFSKG